VACFEKVIMARNCTIFYGTQKAYWHLELSLPFYQALVKVKQSRYRPGGAQRVPGS